MSVNSEIELKGTIEPEHLDQIKDIPAITQHAVGPVRSRRLMTVYYDTPDYDLRRDGLSLRVRKNGSAYVQCVKRAQRRMGGILVRTEWEGVVPSQHPAISVIENKKLRRRIKRAGIKRLQPIFHTDIQRTSQTLTLDDGCTATIDIDDGEVAAGDFSEPICEFELELESGPPRQVFELASEIAKVVPFRLATESKASRGYALLTKDNLSSRKRIRPKFTRGATVEQVLTDLVQHCVDHLQANEAVALKTDDAEGVHQMRIAIRRLRAILQQFKSVLPEDQYDWVVAEAKWLTAELSPARAWDVFADEFVPPVNKSKNGDQGFDALGEAVEAARKHGRQRARDAIGTERYTKFLLRLSAWLTGQDWRNQPVTEHTTSLLEPIGDHCAKQLRRLDRKVRRKGRQMESLSDEELHQLRLAVKRLRFAVDFFEGLYTKRNVKPYRKHLADLRDGLGYLNDVATTDALLRDLRDRADGRASVEWDHAGGQTIGWHRHAAIAVRQEAVKHMNKLLNTKPFWQDGRDC